MFDPARERRYGCGAVSQSLQHTILVVDDSEINRDMLRRRLEKKGYRVVVAENGEQALELCAREPIDLVLLDVMMPGLSGLDVLRILRKSPAGKDLPVIMATAPDLSPRTWYGMPAYAKDGKVVCFFQSAQKFKSRYATLGFSDTANLDKGSMWPTSYALTKLTATAEAEIKKLVKQAVS